jgi:hypothetical protein
MADKSVKITVTADPSGAVSGLKQTEQSVKSLGVQVFATGQALERLGEKALEAFVDAAKAAGELVPEIAKQAERTLQLSEITGMSTDKLQKWDAVFRAAGGTIEDVVAGTRSLSKEIIAAAKGSEDSRASFEKLGVDMRQLGKNADKDFDAIVAGLAKMPPGFERTKLATDLLGKGMANLLPVFSQGLDEFKKVGDEAERFGAILRHDQLAALQKTDNAFDSLSLAIEGTKKQLAVLLAPALQTIIEKMTVLVEKTNEWLASLSGPKPGDVALKIGKAWAAATGDVSYYNDAVKEAARLNKGEKGGASPTPKGLNFGNEEFGSNMLREAMQDSNKLVQSTEQFNAEMERRRQLAAPTFATESELLQRSAANSHADAMQRLEDNKRIADSDAALAAARYETDQSVFKSTTEVRNARMAQIEADAALQVALSNQTTSEIMAIETNANAQRMLVAREYPTFWETSMAQMQNAATQAFANIQSAFASSVAQMIVHGGNFKAFMDQIAVMLLQNFILLGQQMLVRFIADKLAEAGIMKAAEGEKLALWKTTEAARVLITAGANKAIALSNAATMTMFAKSVATVMDIMIEMVASILDVMAAAAAISIVGKPLVPGLQAAAQTVRLGGHAITLNARSAMAGALAGMAIPAAAAGGIVDGPTLLVAGEAGPEAIVPLDRMGDFGGEQHIAVYLDGQVLTEAVFRSRPRVAALHGF